MVYDSDHMSVTVYKADQYDIGMLGIRTDLGLHDLRPRSNLFTAGVGKAERRVAGKGNAKYRRLVPCSNQRLLQVNAEPTHHLASCPDPLES